MARIVYDTAEALIYDPVAGNRATTRSALYAIGFRRIETVATLETFNEFIMRRPPDIAICEAHGAEAALCGAIQGLRQGHAAYNPFIVVIVTAWENSNSLVGRVVDSGADDLILRPYSTAGLEARIRAHVERRKGFVITSDYVGPDRRRNTDAARDVELFKPPNSLKLKAVDRLSGEEAALRIETELKAARETLISEKLRRDAFQICVLWRLMKGEDRPDGGSEVDLTKLRDTARAVSRRARDTDFEDAVEWCESILDAIEGLEVGVDRNASMHLLGRSALNLNQVFSPAKTQDENLAEIDATVATIRARNRTAIAS
jgi:DNA-binding response OmpR family regulator